MSTAQKRPLAAFVLLAVGVSVFVAQSLSAPDPSSSDDVASSSVILINGGQARDDAAPSRPAGQNGFFDGLIAGLGDRADGSASDPSALGPSGDHPRARRGADAGTDSAGPAVTKKKRIRGPKGAQSPTATEPDEKSEQDEPKKSDHDAKKAAQEAKKAAQQAEKAEKQAEKDRRKWERKNRKPKHAQHNSSNHGSHSHGSSSSHGSHSHGSSSSHSSQGHSKGKNRGHSKDKNRGHSKHKNRGHNKGKHRGRR